MDTTWIPSDERERGSRVHEALAAHDTWSDYAWEDWQEPYIEQWADLLSERRDWHGDVEVEKPRYHELMRYAGTPDRVWPEARVVVDIKTGKPDPSYGLQIAAYVLLACDHNGPWRWSGYVVYLSGQDGASAAVELVDLSTAVKTWLHMMDVYHWRAQHGRV
jgi:hypothetical protein